MRVLVTRPEPGANETAARLQAVGHEAVVLPLTEIRPLPAKAAADAAAAAAVAITSANAVRHAPSALVAELAGKPCYVVGERTAEIARELGFHEARSARDVSALAKIVAAQLRPGGSIAYLCGRVRRPEFEAKLAESGIGAAVVETYDTVRRHWPVEAVLEAFGQKPVDAALVYSAAGAEALAALAVEPGLARLFARTRFLCLSDRIAEAVEGLAQGRASVSREPTEAALISLLGTGRAANFFS